ncbi:type VI secretion system baseplate subunit TssK [Sorangium sp. So ce291]|uniref:type VI secretion system baseplate subunit TssK n=1 Tax=Sorangium sp. So ce291 TaxID=3133294 RepID=UPI003F632FAB
MKKVAYQTSRVHWHMGQALLPEHFYAQEKSLREEVALRLRLAPAPAWGLGTLELDGFQLQKGILSIQEMSLVLPSGTIVDIPGNTAPATFNLNTAGAADAPVYVHLQSGYEIVALGAGDAGEEGIERIVQKVELSTNATSETAAQSFQLARFECSPDGLWSLSPRFLPALACVGRSAPLFEDQRRRMRAIARALRQTLLDEVEQNHLAGDSQSAAKQALRGVFSFMALLDDIEQGIAPHPFDVFRALRALYADVCVFRGIDPSELGPRYRHEELAECLEVLLVELEEHAQIGRQSVPYVSFTQKEGMLECVLGPEVRRARDVFLLIKKPQVSTKLELGGVKLASPTRLHTVYERALKGIPFSRFDSPPFHHGFSSNVEFFAVSPGQEWDYAVQEGKVVLFDAPQLARSRLYLYWRGE